LGRGDSRGVKIEKTTTIGGGGKSRIKEEKGAFHDEFCETPFRGGASVRDPVRLFSLPLGPISGAIPKCGLSNAGIRSIKKGVGNSFKGEWLKGSLRDQVIT